MLLKVIRLIFLKIIKKVLLLLHPIAPFVSEEIWNHLKDTNEEDIIISSWPKAKNNNISHNKDEILDFKEIVTSIRTILRIKCSTIKKN